MLLIWLISTSKVIGPNWALIQAMRKHLSEETAIHRAQGWIWHLFRRLHHLQMKKQYIALQPSNVFLDCLTSSLVFVPVLGFHLFLLHKCLVHCAFFHSVQIFPDNCRCFYSTVRNSEMCKQTSLNFILPWNIKVAVIRGNPHLLEFIPVFTHTIF